MIGFDEALAEVVGRARPLGAEEVPLGQAHRRVLAAPVIAAVSAPRADVSMMDGYAVREVDLGASPVGLRVVGESLPGRGFEDALPPGCCVRIFTGAPVPRGADRVVMQEVVQREGEVAVVDATPGAVRFIRAAGSDFGADDVVLEAGTLLGAGQLVAAAAADVGVLSVWRRPLVRLLATGDELVPPGSARDHHEAVPESISVGIAALVEQWGGRFAGGETLPDQLDILEQAAARALAEADIVVVAGGASVGERDFAKQMFEAQGLELIFSNVSMRPGKPVWLGRAGERIVLGLPGNPSSAMVTGRLFLAPLIAGCVGRDPHMARRWRTLPLAGPAPPAGARETFARGAAEGAAVRLSPNQDSGAQRTLARCDLLVRLPAGQEGFAAGGMVDVLDF